MLKTMTRLLLLVFLRLLLDVTSVKGVDTMTFSELTPCPGKVMTSSFTYLTTMTSTKVKCAALCSEVWCKSFQYELSTLMCSLNDGADPGDCTLMTQSTTDNTYWRQNLPCLNGGYIGAEGYCACVDGYIGSSCERLMADCSEGFQSPHAYTSGVYNIHPYASPTSFPVYCTMSSGGRTRILWRTTGMDFYRTWQEYRDGFGDLGGDHWLGLEAIHRITSGGDFQMKFELRLNNGTSLQQYYKYFVVEGEDDDYRLRFALSVAHSTLPLGDCLVPLNGSSFSTFDRDNDNSPLNCAQDFHSGWWFNACADCNPTGRLLLPADGLRTGSDEEVFWTNNLGNVVPIRVYAFVVRM